jgi:hypothetical protein
MKRLRALAVISLLIMSQLSGMPFEKPDGKIPFEKLGHHILVKVKIDDSSEDYNFIVDTGGLTFIDKSVADSLGLKQRGPMAKISTMNLSGYQIKDIFCMTMFDFNLFRKLGTPIHGIIGSNLMDRFTVTFDFQTGSLIFSMDTTSLTVPEDGLFLTFQNHPVNHAPIIELTVNQKMMKGMIDTGQPYPLVLPMNEFEKYTESGISGFIQSKGLMVRWPQTNPSKNYSARLNSCELAGLKMTNTQCLFAELPPLLSMPLIGTDLLSQFRMIINYPKHEILLIPNPDAHFDSNPFSTGLNLNLSESNAVFVEGVWENSPADILNIQVGDHVTAFNSRRVTSENLIELLELMNDDRIKTINLEIKNQNGTRKLNVIKTRLYEPL